MPIICLAYDPGEQHLAYSGILSPILETQPVLQNILRRLLLCSTTVVVVSVPFGPKCVAQRLISFPHMNNRRVENITYNPIWYRIAKGVDSSLSSSLMSTTLQTKGEDGGINYTKHNELTLVLLLVITHVHFPPRMSQFR